MKYERTPEYDDRPYEEEVAPIQRDDLLRRRLTRTGVRQISPIDLLRAVIQEIEDGTINPQGLVILAVREPTAPEAADSKDSMAIYRCGLTPMQQLAALVVAQHRILSRHV